MCLRLFAKCGEGRFTGWACRRLAHITSSSSLASPQSLLTPLTTTPTLKTTRRPNLLSMICPAMLPRLR